MTDIIKVLLSIVLRASDTQGVDRLFADLRCWWSNYRCDNGCVSPGKSTRGLGFTSLPDVAAVIACRELGLDPMVIECSLTYGMSEADAEQLLGEPIWEDGEFGPAMTRRASTHFSYDNYRGCYYMNDLSPFMDMAVVARFITAVLPHDKAGNALIHEDRIIPAPLALLSSKRRHITIMVTVDGTPTFTEACDALGLDAAVVARRLSKDVWNNPIGSRRKVRLLVTKAEEDGSHDGDFFLRPEFAHSPLCLYRGVGKNHLGQAFLLKGRGLAYTNIPDGVDGYTTTDNIKWSKVSPGAVIELEILPCTEESGHAKDGGYGWHSMAMLFMASEEGTRGKMRRVFQGHIEGLRDKFGWDVSQLGFSKKLKDMAVKLDESDDNFAIVNSDISKHVLGLSSPDERRNIWTSHFRKVLTMKTGVSKYPAIIFSTKWEGKEIKPEAPLYNGAMAEWAEDNGLLNKPVTMMRYPVASQGSYLRVSLDKGNQISMADSEPLLIAHPRCAAHLQGDGDDHVLVTAEWISSFDPNNEPAVARGYKKARKMGTLETMLEVWTASNGIGLIFNSMAKSVGAMRALGIAEEKIIEEMVWFGSQLDLYAQAVKKPLALTPPEEIMKRSSKWVKLAKKKGRQDSPHNQLGQLIGTNLRSKKGPAEMAELVQEFYGVTLPEIPLANPIPSGIRPMKNRHKPTVEAFVAKAGKVKNFPQAKAWHAELVKLILGDSTWGDLEENVMLRGIDTYAAIAFRLGVIAQGSEEHPAALAVMNGNWIAASQAMEDGYLA